jgi:hypothetical protein
MPRGDDRNRAGKALAVCLEDERKLPPQKSFLSSAGRIFPASAQAAAGKRGKADLTEEG